MSEVLHMSIRNILVPALAGLVYVAGCGSTDASVGDVPSAGAAGKKSSGASGASAGGASSVAGASSAGEGGLCARFECPAIVCAPGVNTPPSSNGCCPGCGTGAAGSPGSNGGGSESGAAGSSASAEAGSPSTGGTAGAAGCSGVGVSTIACPLTHICAPGESPTQTFLCCMSCASAGGSAGSP
jgi:hypothetical protein